MYSQENRESPNAQSSASTLIEFPGQTPRPQWRKDLSQRVREIQERRAREAAANGKPLPPNAKSSQPAPPPRTAASRLHAASLSEHTPTTESPSAAADAGGSHTSLPDEPPTFVAKPPLGANLTKDTPIAAALRRLQSEGSEVSASNGATEKAVRQSMSDIADGDDADGEAANNQPAEKPMSAKAQVKRARDEAKREREHAREQRTYAGESNGKTIRSHAPSLGLVPSTPLAPVNPIVTAALQRIERAHAKATAFAQSAAATAVALAPVAEPDLQPDDVETSSVQPENSSFESEVIPASNENTRAPKLVVISAPREDDSSAPEISTPAAGYSEDYASELNESFDGEREMPVESAQHKSDSLRQSFEETPREWFFHEPAFREQSLIKSEHFTPGEQRAVETVDYDARGELQFFTNADSQPLFAANPSPVMPQSFPDTEKSFAFDDSGDSAFNAGLEATGTIARIVETPIVEMPNTETQIDVRPTSPAVANGFLADKQFAAESASVNTVNVASEVSATPLTTPLPSITSSPAVAPRPMRRVHLGMIDDALIAQREREESRSQASAQREAQDDRAPLSMRVAASVIDIFAVMFLASPVAGTVEIFHGDWSDLRVVFAVLICTALIMLGYSTLSTAFFGRTWGMKLVGVRPVEVLTGLSPSVSQSFKRAVYWLISVATFGLGLVYALLDPEQRGVHDHLSETVVVKE